MNVATFQFISFLALVYALWRYAGQSHSRRKNVLLVLSYVFYCTWDVQLTAVVAGTTVFQWLVGRQIDIAETRRSRLAWLWISIGAGLGCLCYFKYSGFFIDGLSHLLVRFGLESISPLAVAAAPIGLSFYTFQSFTYTIDIYRGKTKPAASLRDFALFISFFPSVTAGPITKARFLIPQLEAKGNARDSGTRDAIYMIVRGLVKKIAIADVLAAQFVGPAFSTPGSWSSSFLILAVIAYSFEIYMDLSGYTDIARGAARLFGYELEINFNRPYLARTVSEFWQRWHISMSGFFREYLFFSLGGSKTGNAYANILVTFLAIGLWHGAGWNFAIYGLLHGSAVCLERAARTARQKRASPQEAPNRMAHGLGMLYTFTFVAFARILFVEPELAGAVEFVAAIWNTDSVTGAAGWQGYLTLLAAVGLHAMPGNAWHTAMHLMSRCHPLLQGAALAFITWSLVALASEVRPFVYFQF